MNINLKGEYTLPNLKDHIIKSFNKNIINVNGYEYVSLDVFQSAISELAVMESLLGTLVLKINEDVIILEEEAIDYMCKNNELIDIEFDDDKYIIKIKEN